MTLSAYIKSELSKGNFGPTTYIEQAPASTSFYIWNDDCTKILAGPFASKDHAMAVRSAVITRVVKAMR